MEKNSQEGLRLIEQLVSLSGLPTNYAEQKLVKLLTNDGLTAEECNLDQIRDVLANLLQDIILENVEN